MIKSARIIAFLSLIIAVPLAGALESIGDNETGDRAVVAKIVVDGPISPVSADYIKSQVENAQDEDVDLVILQLDTPGGLVSSTRDIVKVLLGSEVPVAVYVAPPGARAASAGVFITMAGHVAAMAPGTNIGAAHPVNMGGGNPLAPEKEEEPETEKRGNGEGEEKGAGRGAQGADEKAEQTDGEKDEGAGRGAQGEDNDSERESDTPALDDKSVMAQKVVNDTVAFARSIAERNGRNADWAERAVRESVSVTETEALELNVIDIIAEDIDELLEAMDGLTVKVSGEEVVLAVKGGTVVDQAMGFRHRVLMTLSDPNIAYILMMLGIYGLFFELANPGVMLPGILGGIFLILAFFSFQVLPINYAGFLLILVAVILFVLEATVVSYGMLSVGGIASLFLGSLMLFDSAEPYYKLSLSLVFGVTIFTALFFILGLGLVIRDMRKQPATGSEGLVGKTGVVTVGLAPEGMVKVHGEIWKARAEGQIEAGSKVSVKAVEGLMVIVEEVENEIDT